MTSDRHPGKSPAYQWYPRDYMADELVIVLTLEEEGAYRKLLDHQWLHQSIPTRLDLLAAICKGIPVARMKKLWVKLEPLFPVVPGDETRRANRRLERERENQQANKERRQQAGRQGGKAKAANKQQGSTGEAPPQQTASNASPLPPPSQQSALANPSPASATAPATATPPANAVVVARGDGGDRGSSVKGWDAWLAEVPELLLPAVEGALRSGRDPDARRRELLALSAPITGGPAYPAPVVAQALQDLAVAGSPITSTALRAFCRRLVSEAARDHAAVGATSSDAELYRDA